MSIVSTFVFEDFRVASFHSRATQPHFLERTLSVVAYYIWGAGHDTGFPELSRRIREHFKQCICYVGHVRKIRFVIHTHTVIPLKVSMPTTLPNFIFITFGPVHRANIDCVSVSWWVLYLLYIFTVRIWTLLIQRSEAYPSVVALVCLSSVF